MVTYSSSSPSPPSIHCCRLLKMPSVFTPVHFDVLDAKCVLMTLTSLALKRPMDSCNNINSMFSSLFVIRPRLVDFSFFNWKFTNCS